MAACMKGSATFGSAACPYLTISLSCYTPPTLSRTLFLVPSLQADWKKLRVKELRKICDDEGIDAKGFMEKEEYLKAIKKHFNIKDEV